MVIHFKHSSVYMSIPSSLNIPPFAEINEKGDIKKKKSLITAIVITKAKEQIKYFVSLQRQWLSMHLGNCFQASLISVKVLFYLPWVYLAFIKPPYVTHRPF